MNLSKAKKIKLAHLLRFVKELSTDKGLIVIDGETEIGNDVFIYDEQGEVTPAPDGEYTAENVVIIMGGGKIVEIRKLAKEEESINEPITDEVAKKMEETPEELHTRIAELEAAVAERDEKIKELEAELKKYQEKEVTPVAEPAEDEKTVEMSAMERRQNNALDIVSFLKR